MSQNFITRRSPESTLEPAVADIDELKLVGCTDIDDRQGVYVEDERSLYFYDYDSVLAESLPDIVEPTAGAGRWIRHGYGAGGSPSDLFRLKWEQPNVIGAGMSVLIEADNELILSKLDIEDDGEIDIQGDLVLLEDAAYRPRFSQPMTIAADEGYAIPEGDQLIVAGNLAIDGHLDVRGDLIFITV